MATITPRLSRKKDLETGKVEILIRFRHGKIDQYAGSNVFINPKYWYTKRNKDTGKMVSGISIPNARLLTSEIKNLQQAKSTYEGLINYVKNEFLAADKEIITEDWLSVLIDKFHFPDKYRPKGLEKEKPLSFFEYINAFIDMAPKRKDKDTGRLLSYNSVQQYRATYQHLKNFAAKELKNDFEFEEINTKFYNKFVAYLQSLDFTNNSIGKHIKVIKTFINDAPKDLKNKADISRFHVFSEDADTVFLNEDELKQIQQCNLSGKLEKVRDHFLLLAWTGCRYSDSEKISKTDIKDGFITFRQQKTNEKVTIPIHPAVVEVLEKYNYQMPKPLSNQRFNEYIKEVAKAAGINRLETITKTVGGKLTSIKMPKYCLIGSHTGRRSFCTNMYLLGIPTYTIMAISGHRTEKSFLKYLKVSKEEHAKLMRDAWERTYNKM